jgi:inosose dehydratase
MIQTEHETRTLMKLTDPKYVWMTADTAHLTLGGMDPIKVIKDYWPRIAEIHYKDAPRKLRGSKVVAVPRSGPEAGGHGWFRNLNDVDGGGVDFPTLQKYLIAQNYKGWCVLDLDASMIPKGSNMEEVLKGNIKYMVDVLHVDPKTV